MTTVRLRMQLLALAVIFAALLVWWLRMHHVLHLHNAGRTAFTVGVALDNQPFVYFEETLPPGSTRILRFQRNAEAGYVFYEVRGATRTEVGRCGYTDKRVNEYLVDVAPGLPFSCDEISTGGPFPLP